MLGLKSHRPVHSDWEKNNVKCQLRKEVTTQRDTLEILHHLGQLVSIKLTIPLTARHENLHTSVVSLCYLTYPSSVKWNGIFILCFVLFLHVNFSQRLIFVHCGWRRALYSNSRSLIYVRKASTEKTARWILTACPQRKPGNIISEHGEQSLSVFTRRRQAGPACSCRHAMFQFKASRQVNVIYSSV